MSLTYGSLFSGVGGLDLAVEAVTGATPVWHAEIEPGPAAVLAHHWPTVPNLGDITAIGWADVPPVDILCGGFPCQDISTAGRGAGIKEGTRSGLWYRYADAVRIIRPRYVFVENVAALLVRGLDVVLGSLAELGYDTEWMCLRASDVGAPHARNRVFVVAADGQGEGLEGARLRGRPAFGGGAPADASHVGHERSWSTRGRGTGPEDSGHAPADADGDGARRPAQVQDDRIDPRARTTDSDMAAHQWGDYAAAITRWETLTGLPAPNPTDDRGRLNPQLAEWMMGFQPGHVTDLLPRTAALRAIGNAVCPQQATAAYTHLLDRLPVLEAAS